MRGRSIMKHAFVCMVIDPLKVGIQRHQYKLSNIDKGRESTTHHSLLSSVPNSARNSVQPVSLYNKACYSQAVLITVSLNITSIELLLLDDCD